MATGKSLKGIDILYCVHDQFILANIGWQIVSFWEEVENFCQKLIFHFFFGNDFWFVKMGAAAFHVIVIFDIDGFKDHFLFCDSQL